MVIPIEEAKSRYADYIEAVTALRQKLKARGVSIAVSDDFELGGHWSLSYKSSLIANFEWNVPYSLIYIVAASGYESESFEIDNVKNLKDWCEFLADIEKSLILLMDN